MARFRLPSLSPNVKAYFSHFGRTILIITALLIIVGLAAGTYFYGQRKHDEDKPQQTASTNNPSPATDQNQGATQTPSNPQNQGSSPTNQPTPPSQGGTPTPNTGPTTLSNTGPADWAGPIMAALLVLSILYRHSRRELNQALTQV